MLDFKVERISDSRPAFKLRTLKVVIATSAFAIEGELVLTGNPLSVLKLADKGLSGVKSYLKVKFQNFRFRPYWETTS